MGDSFLLQIRDSDSPPLPPVMLFSQLSDNGVVILITFDTLTNMAGLPILFDCTLLLSFSLDTSCSCQWKDSGTIHVTVVRKLSMVLLPGSPITLKDKKLKAVCPASATASKCSSYPSAETQVTLLLPPLNPVSPKISLTMPLQIACCEPHLYLDPTG